MSFLMRRGLQMTTVVVVEKKFSLCGMSIRPAVKALTLAQIAIVLGLGLSYRLLLDLGTIISVVLAIHIFCAAVAVLFLIFLIIGRKFGSIYEVILHAHLLAILLVGMTSFFCSLYLALMFFRQRHSWLEGIHWVFLIAAAVGMVPFQILQRNANEQMLTYIEHSFK